MTQWQTLSVTEAEAMLYDSPMLLLDMRDFRSYLSGHHPAALHLNDTNLRALLRHTARSVPVLIYCYHGHASQDMAQLFSDFGFTSCYSLDGGYEAWYPSISRPLDALSHPLRGWLVEHGFDPYNLDQRGDNQDTALMQACRDGNLDIARELVMAGAGIDLVNKDGNNALWMACLSENSRIVQLLLDNDIDMDQQNDHGATALIYAASIGHDALVAQLLEAGADASPTTKDDFSVLDVAARASTLRLLQHHILPDTHPVHRFVA
ncbi:MULTISPECIES: ankyrin repeat domain-containing protein [unclassified Oceanobacter]|jgi:thiosulfate/3-mercaptopyruvate sulfurtransferase|uniref:ankyrin repeat domain-containing protein n=1 Tax=unclassified Oceanobacter TaxID=2620260 RepID=UPI0026E3BE44|nr:MULTISPECIES: ankyrin repeat domain-containing protein [unclassified Oceanobacter]MDO6681720.1 ankyrin repeat domain-containing protein [Oceanobacter sp. 5_MG-2023]MDP2547521.1 ankyrin repeat domain-containing protein [Oceanobacter sp. 4_MG-2023]MDP2608309.1 ankyrin repeat domain-containing protein [Oceanobacter sp. 1_MG-2023]MDP2612194.1 ankyrin repeat domain-containing protein [Oceanobacter sp. 2_MG-2023]